jgi:hypothetical protein
LKSEGTLRDVRGGARSQARSELGVDSIMGNENEVEAEAAVEEVEEETGDVNLAKLTDRLLEVIRADEQRFRGLAWEALREALEDSADEVRIGRACRCMALMELFRETFKCVPC